MKRGIHTRLITSYLLLILLTLSLLSGYLLWFFYRHNLAILSDSLFTQARMTEQFLEPLMTGPLPKASIDDQIKELSAKNHLRITVIDTAGTVVADSWENPALMENHLSRPEVSLALAGGDGKAIRHSTTISQSMLYVAVPIQSNGETLGTVRIASTLAAVDAGFDSIKTTLLVSILLTALLTLLLSIRIARKFTAPLETITQSARDFGRGHLSGRVHIRTGDELEVLAHTLNTLAANLDDTINKYAAENQKLSIIMENMDNAVLLLDHYGRITLANNQARSSFSIKDDMLKQHNFNILGNSQLNQAVQDTLRQGNSQLLTLKISLQGHKRVFQVFLASISSPGDVPGVLSVFHDITALQELQERQADFIANASHELATPLTSIKGFAETLLDGASADPQLREKFITIIHQESQRMQRLLTELLQLARLNSQEYRQQVEFTSLRPLELLHTAWQTLETAAAYKQIAVSLPAAADSLSVNGNADWLKQIFTNLIDNAIKYTPAGGSITITCSAKDGSAQFTFADTGIGIPSQDLPRIFDRFYRVDKSRTRMAGGTGLGLAIVKFAAEMHGGTISASSTPGIGTTFTLTLPLA